MPDEPVDLNLEELKELIRLLKESNVTEFEFRKADYRLRIRQGTIVDDTMERGSVAIPLNGEQPQKLPLIRASEPIVTSALEPELLHEVRSPIVGTFYRTASPGSAPFVEVGDRVRKNQVLCIVEAMKIMNEIESDLDGVVRAIHAANGQPVEFGELLFSIKPS